MSQKPATPSGDGRLAMRTPDLGRFLRGAGHAGPAGAQRAAGERRYGVPDPGSPEPDGAIPELGVGRARGRSGGGGARGGSGRR